MHCIARAGSNANGDPELSGKIGEVLGRLAPTRPDGDGRKRQGIGESLDLCAGLTPRTKDREPLRLPRPERLGGDYRSSGGTQGGQRMSLDDCEKPTVAKMNS